MNDAQPPDDSTEPDPVDAELIAYLDGELEATDARRIEDQLDGDPKLRARAEGLKRSFDLLDFLPKPEPSSNFATRTMDKLPVSAKPAGVATTVAPLAIPSSMSSLALPGFAARRPAPSWAWALGLFLAVGVALGSGYLGTAAARKYFAAGSARDAGADALTIADIRIVENLPLYAAVDDLDFLNLLAAPEFFGDELTTPEGLVPAQPVETDKLSEKQVKELAQVFRGLTPERQEKIRTFDQQLIAQEPARRDRSYRLLEIYAAWLQRLPDADRKEVLAAPTSAKRIDAIREVHRKQWIAALPAAQRQKLSNLAPADKADLIAKWRTEDEKNRAEWSLVRVQGESIRTGRQPWPFTEERMKKEVVAFLDAAYRPDDPKRNRLSQGPDGGDLARYREALERAGKGEWAFLGKVVLDFTKKYESLPEPAKGNPVIDFADLSTWPVALKHFENRPKLKPKFDASLGKWPEFALAIHTEMSGIKLPVNLPTYHLGPCRPDEFKDDVKRFIPELRKKLNEAESNGLKSLEGQWPAYPRELVRLAKGHDLAVPGAMPPGLPSLWEKTYGRPMRTGG